jgi:lipopolysaccharide/colanic/teichoic acid biosynthesis glycosyltransferase
MFARIIDICFALVGLLLLMLILPWIALLIKIDSRGPVFYRCKRVGLGGHLFEMYKFRTMYETPVQLGPSLSPLGDPRVTQVGRILRRTKLNELPQFINLLIGDMTLIGPRPEALDLAAAYPKEAKEIFSVKPGLAGPNQILGRNEEEVFPPGVDPIKFYIEQILPKKLPLDLEYIHNKSIFKDLKFLFLAVKVTITKTITRRHLLHNRSQIALFSCDMVFCLLSFTLAHSIRFFGMDDPESTQVFYRLLPWAALTRIPAFLYFGFYYIIIRHFALFDIKRIFLGVASGSMIFVLFSLLSGFSFLLGPGFSIYARGVFLIDFCSLTTLLIGYRVLLKKWCSRHQSDNGLNIQKKKVIIWGAGDAGELCLRYFQKQQNPGYQVVGFIDDDPGKRGKGICGIRVLGDRHQLPIIAKLYEVEEIFISIPSASIPEINLMLAACRQADLVSYLFEFKATEFDDLMSGLSQSARTDRPSEGLEKKVIAG